VSVEVAGQAVQTAARDRPFHPVKKYLQGLHWDGVERGDRWLATHLGTGEAEYSRAVGVCNIKVEARPNTVHLTRHFCGILFWAYVFQKEVVPCAFPLWNQPLL